MIIHVLVKEQSKTARTGGKAYEPQAGTLYPYRCSGGQHHPGGKKTLCQSAFFEPDDPPREIRQENSGLLRLGISVQRAIQILPVALPWFTMQYPKVSVDLREEGSARLEELLEAGEIDLALAAVESVSPALSFTLIEKEVIGVLAGKNSAIANQLPPGTPINLNMIREDAFVSLKPGHSVRVVQDTLFRAGGIKPQILLETDSLEVAKRVAIQAGACMLCSDIFMDEYARRGGVFYPLMDYENKRHLYACWRKDEKLPQYAVGFIQIVTRILDKNSARL